MKKKTFRKKILSTVLAWMLIAANVFPSMAVQAADVTETDVVEIMDQELELLEGDDTTTGDDDLELEYGEYGIEFDSNPDIVDFEDSVVSYDDQPDFSIDRNPVDIEDSDVPLGTLTGSNPYTGVESPAAAALAAAGASAILLFATGKRKKK